MLPSPQERQQRVRACVADLLENGIDLLRASDGVIREVVRDHLDYFQLMLGENRKARQVVSLIKHELRGAVRMN